MHSTNISYACFAFSPTILKINFTLLAISSLCPEFLFGTAPCPSHSFANLYSRLLGNNDKFGGLHFENQADFALKAKVKPAVIVLENTTLIAKSNKKQAAARALLP